VEAAKATEVVKMEEVPTPTETPPTLPTPLEGGEGSPHLWEGGTLDTLAQRLEVYLPAFGDYGQLLLQGGVTAVLLVILALLARLLGHYPRFGSGGRAPTSAYECGFAPFAGLASSSLFLFYQLAVFFVVFEAELVFLYPWASALLPAAEVGALQPFLAPLAFLLALFYGYAREIQADALRV